MDGGGVMDEVVAEREPLVVVWELEEVVTL